MVITTKCFCGGFAFILSKKTNINPRMEFGVLYAVYQLQLLFFVCLFVCLLALNFPRAAVSP